MMHGDVKTNDRPAFKFQPYAPGYDENPHAVYEQMRQHAPVYYWDEGRAWMLSKHDDILALLRDTRFTPNREAWEFAAQGGEASVSPELEEVNKHGLFALSDQNHARVRKLVSPALTPRAIERLRPDIQGIVDEIIDGFANRDSINVVNDFAEQIPARVIGSMLKIAKGREQLFHAFTYAVVKCFVPGLVQRDEHEQLRRDIREGLHLVGETIEDRRLNPLENDILTTLLQTEEQGDKLSKPELLSLAAALIVGGFETTVHLIGFTALNLLRRPEVVAQLKAEPELVKNLVEEVLRHDNFGKMGIVRYALEDVELGGARIKKGQMVLLMLGSGLRDEAVFEKANVFDVRRGTNAGIAFGNGAHYCIGANLARLEVQIAIDTLVRRFPEMALAGPPTFGPHPVIRKLETLSVRLHPTAARG